MRSFWLCDAHALPVVSWATQTSKCKFANFETFKVNYHFFLVFSHYSKEVTAAATIGPRSWSFASDTDDEGEDPPDDLEKLM
jgi:hypothetical protein